jgi:hypothetical protein
MAFGKAALAVFFRGLFRACSLFIFYKPGESRKALRVGAAAEKHRVGVLFLKFIFV